MNTERIIEDIDAGLCSYCEREIEGKDLLIDQEGDLVCVRCSKDIYEDIEE